MYIHSEPTHYDNLASSNFDAAPASELAKLRSEVEQLKTKVKEMEQKM